MTKLRCSDPDDVPEIQLATGQHGSPTNPHVVRSPTALFCIECREPIGGMLIERLNVALADDAARAVSEPLGERRKDER